MCIESATITLGGRKIVVGLREQRLDEDTVYVEVLSQLWVRKDGEDHVAFQHVGTGYINEKETARHGA